MAARSDLRPVVNVNGVVLKIPKEKWTSEIAEASLKNIGATLQQDPSREKELREIGQKILDEASQDFEKQPLLVRKIQTAFNRALSQGPLVNSLLGVSVEQLYKIPLSELKKLLEGLDLAIINQKILPLLLAPEKQEAMKQTSRLFVVTIAEIIKELPLELQKPWINILIDITRVYPENFKDVFRHILISIFPQQAEKIQENKDNPDFLIDFLLSSATTMIPESKNLLATSIHTVFPSNISLQDNFICTIKGIACLYYPNPNNPVNVPLALHFFTAGHLQTRRTLADDFAAVLARSPNLGRFGDNPLSFVGETFLQTIEGQAAQLWSSIRETPDNEQTLQYIEENMLKGQHLAAQGSVLANSILGILKEKQADLLEKKDMKKMAETSRNEAIEYYKKAMKMGETWATRRIPELL